MREIRGTHQKKKKNERDKRLRVKSLFREWKDDIVYLQETKLEFVSRAIVCRLWGFQYVDCCWSYLGSRGGSR